MKWITIANYINVETGEALTKEQSKEYIKIKTIRTTKFKINKHGEKTHGYIIRTTTYRNREWRQPNIFEGGD